MASDPPDSNRVDPLSNIRGLSQFPNSVRVSSDSNDLDSIHQTIKSLGVNNPEKVVEEAKKIVDGGPELLDSNYATFIGSMDIDDASLQKEDEKPLQNRPGLGRRRAKFSMKRNSSQPPPSLLTSFDVTKFPDPEEYFAALQKHENAQKEIKRLMGVSSIEDDIPQHTALKRGPGILGNRRRSVTYKHQRAQVISETKEIDVPSPEPMELTVPKSPNNDSHKVNNDFEVELPDCDAAGPKTEHEVNIILDQLLSSNSEDLDGYATVSLLHERLNIKPIDLSTLSIPNYNDSEKIDYVALGKNLPLPQRSSFSVEKFKQGTPLSQKQILRSANSSLESSTPRNLLGSLSELRKRVMQSNPLGDLFSPLDIDLMEPQNSEPDEGSEPTKPNTGLGERSTESILAGISTRKILSRQSSHVDVSKNMSPGEGSEPTESNTGLGERSAEGSLAGVCTGNILSRQSSPIDITETDGGSEPTESNTGLWERSAEGNLVGVSTGKILSRQSSHVDVAENISPDEGSEPTESNRGLGKRSTEGSLAGVSTGKILSRQSSHADVVESLSHTKFLFNDDDVNEIDGNRESTGNAGVDILMDGPPRGKENVEDAPNLPMSSVEGLERTVNVATDSSSDNHAPSLMQENVKDMPSAVLSAQVEISCNESLISDKEVHQKSLDGPHTDSIKECTSEMLPTARIRISEKETKKLPLNQERKRKKYAIGVIERKSLSQRRSILAGGTTFESGVRRSKRIKTRPLEYWKGERFLYERVNGSIKLTGMQYVSPSKDNGMLKVKSFI